MSRPSHAILLSLFAMSITPSYTARAEGDQFLDGIGETALIARYVFDGNLEDGSRNSLHAAMNNGSPAFVDDDQFGRVLALPDGANGSFIRVPDQILNEMDTFSFTGWFKLDALDRDRCFLSISDDSSQFGYAILSRVGSPATLGAVLISKDGSVEKNESFRPNQGRWFHLAVVQDIAGKKMAVYIDGKPFFESAEMEAALAEKLNASDSKALNLNIGEARGKKAEGFGGKLHDVRFYRTALTDRQVAVIHHNAISDEKWGDENAADEAAENYRAARPHQLDADLIGVADVQLETPVGELPHLPWLVQGIYRNQKDGPPVRVLWPAPRDNSAVLKTGTYTVTGTVPGTGFTPVATVTVRKSPEAKPPQKTALEAFALGQVILNPDSNGNATPFMKHRDKFLKGLAQTDPNTFLYNFRDAFGQPQPAGTQPLYGWDSETTRLRGHATGHYLTAIAQAYAGTTYDPKLHAVFEKKMDTMIDVLYELSKRSGKPAKAGGPSNADPAAVPPGPGKSGFDSDLSKNGIRTDYWNWGEGFISGYPPDQFIMLEHGASYGADNSRIWAPYYTLHKILAGLMDCYETGGNPKALDVAKGMGLWVYNRLKILPDDTRIRMWNSYIAGEYGGMNEAMARLSLLTGDERFLECARLFDNTTFFFGDAAHDHGLACNVDTIRGRHANQHIPQITGALETYAGTHDPAYYRIVDNFWNLCTHSYMYSIGGVAGARNPNNAECFPAEPDTLFRNGLSDGGQNETCATYNLLKLGRRLFLYEPDAGYMDYYERALYNHILASVAEHDSGNTYHVPLNPGAVKSFGNAEMNSFTCCNGTALESATKLQNSIYFKTADNKALYVNLYISSTLNWKERNVGVTQNTRYPYSDTVTLTINGSGAFDLNLRIPQWARRGIALKFNGKPAKVEAGPGSYLKLSRKWKNGDMIELRLPMDFHLMPLMDQPNIASIFYGPVLLAAEEPEARTTWRRIKLDPAAIGAAFQGDPSTLRFESDGIRFKPFFETYGRHSVYLDIVPQRTDAQPPITAIDPPEQDFFAKQLDFRGISIKSSAAVEDRALYVAADKLAMMLAHLPEAANRLAEAGAELHIIGRNEVTTDLPEWRQDKGVPLEEYNGQTRDERTRGMGGLQTSCGEENLLRLPEDRYRGTDICVHEFAHNVMYYGAPPEIAERFEAQRQQSLTKGLWVGSYAGSNVQEFFAELAMWYFGTQGNLSMEGPKPDPGPEGLNAYDPEAYQLVDDFWSGRLMK